MSTGFKIEEQDGLYFVTFQIVKWIDIFTRKFIIKSRSFCFNTSTIIILYILLISCNNAKDYSKNVSELDMINSKEIAFDELVTDVECYQLNESGGNSYWKIIAYNDFFYLYAFDGISIFKKSGEHVRTITNHIRGNPFRPTDILINEKERQLWILEQFENINTYSLDGQFIEQKKLPFRALKIVSTGTDHFLFFEGVVDKTTSSFLRIVSDIDFSTNAAFVQKYNINNSIPISTFSYSRDETFIYLPYNDTIYICDNTNLNVTPKWRLDFSGDFLTHRDLPEGGYSDARYAEIIKENKTYRSLRGVHYVNKFIFMRLEGKDNSFRAIDITNNNTYRFNALIDNIKTVPQGNTTNSLLVVMTTQDFVQHYSNPNNCTKYESVEKVLNQLNEYDSGLIVLNIILKEDLP